MKSILTTFNFLKINFQYKHSIPYIIEMFAVVFCCRSIMDSYQYPTGLLQTDT